MPNALPRLRRTLSRVALASLTAVGITPPVLAADSPGALEKMLVDDSALTLQLRTYAMDRHKPGTALNEAWAASGWLDYRSGWLGDMLGIGLVGYTSQPLWAPSDAAGTCCSPRRSKAIWYSARPTSRSGSGSKRSPAARSKSANPK